MAFIAVDQVRAKRQTTKPVSSIVTACCLILSAGCISLGHARLYDGPPRPGTEVAILRWKAPAKLCAVNGRSTTLFSSEDIPSVLIGGLWGLAPGSVRELELLPGDYTLTVWYFNRYNLGPEQITEKAQAKQEVGFHAEAGHLYDLKATAVPISQERGMWGGAWWYPEVVEAPQLFREQKSLAELEIPRRLDDARAGLWADSTFLAMRENRLISDGWSLGFGGFDTHCFLPGARLYLRLKHTLPTVFGEVVELGATPAQDALSGANVVLVPRFVRLHVPCLLELRSAFRRTLAASVEYNVDVFDGKSNLIDQVPVIGRGYMKGFPKGRTYYGPCDVLTVVDAAIDDAVSEMVQAAYSRASEAASRID